MKEFFSHDHNARNDPKLLRLMMKHGLKGVGAYWCIIEMLSEEDGYLMRSECERIAFELRTDSDFINHIINDYELFEVDDEQFYSESLLRRLKVKYDKSEKARESANRRWNKKKKQEPMRTHSDGNANAMRNECDGNAIKLNKTKQNETTLNKKTKVIEVEVGVVTVYEFEEFWEYYGKKKDRNKCESKWKKIPESQREVIKEFLPLYIHSTPDIRYRKNPLTFLNAETWNDDWNTYANEINSQNHKHNGNPTDKNHIINSLF